ncbi:MAG: DUF6288 domain-containing protein [Planctomycetota bacterium]|jgi:hypothetical protein
MSIKVLSGLAVFTAALLGVRSVVPDAAAPAAIDEQQDVFVKSKRKKDRSKEDILRAWNADPKAPNWEMGDLAPWMENGKYASKERRAAAPFWMGPAGFKAKLDRVARTYVVTEIVTDSPADGILKVGDMIIGANKIVFADSKAADDYPKWARSNVLYGNSIIESWENETSLDLLLKTDDGTETVAIEIPGIGKFGSKFPLESELSDALVTMSCELLAQRQRGDGSWDKGNNKGSGNRITTSLCALALLASGDSKYKSNIKRAAKWVAALKKTDSFPTWNHAYQAIFLGEYYATTKDKSVLQALQLCADDLSLGQFDYYGSGHGNHTGNYRGSGITICTTHALLGMAYAKLSGSKVSTHRLTTTLEHVERISPHGGVPYTVWGNAVEKLDTRVPAEPAGRNEHAARSGSAATAFHLSGGNSEHLKRLGKFLSTNSDWMDNGHTTGNSVSWLWGSMGLWLTNEKAFHEHMNRRRWWIAMKRRHDGGTMAQPAECINHRSGDGAMGPNVEVAVQTLVLAATKKNLLMCGKILTNTGADKRKSRLMPMPHWARHNQRLVELNLLAEYFETHLKKAKQRKAAAKFASECHEDWAKLSPDDRQSYGKKSTDEFRQQANKFKAYVDLLDADKQSMAVELFTGIKLHAQVKATNGGGNLTVFAGYVPFGEVSVEATLLLDGKEIANAKANASSNNHLEYKNKLCELKSVKPLWTNGELPELKLVAEWQGLVIQRTYRTTKPDDVPKWGYTGASPLFHVRAVIVGWSNEGMKATTLTGDTVTYSINAMGEFEDGDWKVLGKGKKQYLAGYKPRDEVTLLVYEDGPNRWFVHAIDEEKK